MVSGRESQMELSMVLLKDLGLVEIQSVLEWLHAKLLTDAVGILARHLE